MGKPRGEGKLYAPILVLIILVAVLSLAVAYSNRGITASDLKNDAACYHELAISMLERGQYSGNFTALSERFQYDATYRPPGYPAFLALIYLLAGKGNIAAVFYVQAILFAFTIYIVYLIMLEITQKRRHAMVAALVCSLYPMSYQSIPMALSEIVSGAVLAVTILLLLKARAKGSPTYALWAGVFISLSAFFKPIMLPFGLIAAVMMFFPKGAVKKSAACAALLICGCAVTILPWTVRNYVRTGEIIPVATGFGYNFWLGNWPELYQPNSKILLMPDDLYAKTRNISMVEKDRIFLREGLSYITENPLRAGVNFGRKFGCLWLGHLGISPKESPVWIAVGDFGIFKGTLIYVLLFAVAIGGWVGSSAEVKRRSLPVAAVLLLWTFSYVLVTAQERYALPVSFYECAFAALWVARKWDAISSRHASGNLN